MCLVINKELTKEYKKNTGKVIVKKSLYPIYLIPDDRIVLTSPIIGIKHTFTQGINLSNRTLFNYIPEILFGRVYYGFHVYLDDTNDYDCQWITKSNITCKFEADWKHFIAAGEDKDLVFSQLVFTNDQYVAAMNEGVQRLIRS